MSGQERTNALIPIDNFAYEIRTDLQTLIASHPTGVSIADLHEFYGESPTRIQRAITILEGKGVISIHRAANHQHYILPNGYKIAQPLAELTDLQRRLCLLLHETCAKAKTSPPTIRMTTNYAQLARLLSCSNGGVRTCLQRLEQLGYLHIVAYSQQGKQDGLILEMTSKLMDEMKTS